MNERNQDEELLPDGSRAVDFDLLRDKIWDHLFKSKSVHPLSEIAQLVECDVDTTRSAVSHEWFRLADDRVSLAYVGGK